ncbi:hypothetical protein CO608_04310 [Lysobacteraceae bacterium NML08-0793]|nr:hypothetical protein CO608_04310 [Xanthomonadaceae bacterium NML08-0793]
MRLLLMGVSLLGLLACASGAPRLSEAERLDLYQAHAGAPVSSMPYRGAGTGFEIIDDEHLLLTQGASRGWLLQVAPPCLSQDRATAMLLVTSHIGQINVGLDAVGSRSYPGMRCRITRIRPVDMKALRAAQKNTV